MFYIEIDINFVSRSTMFTRLRRGDYDSRKFTNIPGIIDDTDSNEQASHSYTLSHSLFYYLSVNNNTEDNENGV